MEYEILNEYQERVVNIKNDLDYFISVCRGDVDDNDEKGKNKFTFQRVGSW